MIRLVLWENRNREKKRVYAEIKQDEKGPFIVLKGWTYRTNRSDIMTGLSVYERTDYTKKGK